MHLIKPVLLAGFLLLTSRAEAAFTQCYSLDINVVAVERNREDNFGFQNHMVIKLSEACGGSAWVHVEIDHPLMEEFLAVALAAKTTGTTVNVGVNTSTQIQGTNQVAHQLAYIAIAD